MRPMETAKIADAAGRCMAGAPRDTGAEFTDILLSIAEVASVVLRAMANLLSNENDQMLSALSWLFELLNSSERVSRQGHSGRLAPIHLPGTRQIQWRYGTVACGALI